MKKTMFKDRLSRAAWAAAVGGVLAGCAGGNLAPGPASAPTGTAKGPKFKGPSSDAGVSATQSADAGKEFTQMVALKAGSFHPRTDPFSLTQTEKSFDLSQQAERVFGQIGGFANYAQPEPSVPPQVTVEPQPYRRLAGVVVGDSVLAIAEMGNGQPPVIIRPGMHIPNTEWTVVSIDQDKAILRRDGNVLPKEIEVRLETPPPGYGPSGGIPAAPGTGTPGGFPGGFPGGGGGRFPGGGGAPGGGGGAGGD